VLIERYSPDLTIPDLNERLLCGGRGNRDAHLIITNSGGQTGLL
jgi:hypothetical protein